jgi:glucan phosphoethanolaminetransferase (alkaline phosphatase superfamily)
VYIVTTVKPFSNHLAQDILQSAGMCGVIYLIFFGYIALLMMCRVYLRLPKALGMILSLLVTLSISYVPIVAGYAYISGGLHEAIDARLSNMPHNWSK